MLNIAATALALLAMLAWFSALLHGGLLLRHRRDDLSVLELVFRGYLFYAPGTWKPSGQLIHRRFIGSCLAFFVCAVFAGVLAAIGAR